MLGNRITAFSLSRDRPQTCTQTYTEPHVVAYVGTLARQAQNVGFRVKKPFALHPQLPHLDPALNGTTRCCGFGVNEDHNHPMLA
jgi:hypothetical protein